MKKDEKNLTIGTGASKADSKEPDTSVLQASPFAPSSPPPSLTAADKTGGKEAVLELAANPPSPTEVVIDTSLHASPKGGQLGPPEVKTSAAPPSSPTGGAPVISLITTPPASPKVGGAPVITPPPSPSKVVVVEEPEVQPHQASGGSTAQVVEETVAEESNPYKDQSLIECVECFRQFVNVLSSPSKGQEGESEKPKEPSKEEINTRDSILRRIQECIAKGDNPRLKDQEHPLSAKEIARELPYSQYKSDLIAALRPQGFFAKMVDILRDTIESVFRAIASVFTTKQSQKNDDPKKEQGEEVEGDKKHSATVVPTESTEPPTGTDGSSRRRGNSI